MDYSKIVTKEDVELETLKTFLHNANVQFSDKLIEHGRGEPTDIRYDGTNYQITIGDKEAVEERRKVTSKKGSAYSNIRDVSNIISLLLNGALTKKSLRSDKETILLIDVMSTGGLDWDTLRNRASEWANNNQNLCQGWKKIYLVFRQKNIQIEF